MDTLPLRILQAFVTAENAGQPFKTFRALRDVVHVGSKYAQTAMHYARDRGWLMQDERGTYGLTDSGRAVVLVPSSYVPPPSEPAPKKGRPPSYHSHKKAPWLAPKRSALIAVRADLRALLARLDAMIE